MEKTVYSNIIAEFVDRHGLPKGQVISEIERTFSGMLSKWHKKNVVVLFSEEGIHAQAYEKTPNGLIQIPIELKKMKGWNTIKRILDQNLSKASLLQKIRKYKRLEHTLVRGEILRKNNNGHLAVEINLELFQPIIATCLINHIGVHERHLIRPGDVKAFHVRRVEPVSLNGTPRLRISVDRVSKTLVELLLKERCEEQKNIKIKCTKRYVGHKSFVSTNQRIWKKHILDVRQELREHIQVTIKRD